MNLIEIIILFCFHGPCVKALRLKSGGEDENMMRENVTGYIAVEYFLLSCLWSFVEGYEITSGNPHFSPALRKAPIYLSFAD